MVKYVLDEGQDFESVVVSTDMNASPEKIEEYLTDFVLIVDEGGLPTTKAGNRIDIVAMSNASLILQEFSWEHDLRLRFAHPMVVQHLQDVPLTHISHFVNTHIVDFCCKE